MEWRLKQVQWLHPRVLLRSLVTFNVTLNLPVFSLLAVPRNFPQELRHYTMQGFRVIAFAHKALSLGNLSEVESLSR